MPGRCRIAFKEWAAVCAALADGRQTLLVRKGGIQEEAGRFRPDYDAFWLYPTRFHQSADELRPAAHELLDTLPDRQPPAGQIAFREFCRVAEIRYLDRADQLADLEDLQILAPETLRQRFDYRTPGLYVLLVRVFRQEPPQIVPETPACAGCRTWVELDEELPLDAVQPVLTDDDFQQRAADFCRRFPSTTPTQFGLD